MEIGYKTILKYLCDEEDNSIYFPAKKNIMVSSEHFPEKFSEFLKADKNQFFRYGVTNMYLEKSNISFLTSVLTLLDKKFISFDDKEEENYIKTFIEQLKIKVKQKSFNFELKYKFSVDTLLDRINKMNFADGLLIQLITQILDINIIIFDFKTSKINSVFNGDYLNPWKVTILLANESTNWEPIFSNKKQFCFNDNFLKDILTNEEIIYFNEEFLQKYYSLLDNIDEIRDNTNDSEDETFINPKNEIKQMNLNKSKLKNMKKESILEIFEKLNIEVSSSSNKKDLIDKLLEYI